MKFNIICLGAGLVKTKNGFMTEGGRSDGSWACFKCFYGEEGSQEYGEFYLNINLETLEGELVMKDPYYAPKLIAAFTKAMAVGE